MFNCGTGDPVYRGGVPLPAGHPPGTRGEDAQGQQDVWQRPQVR